jgi:histidinol-phosphate phosphatase family protein
MTNKTPKAIFLDRDGTIIRDKNYLSQLRDIEYYDDTHPALNLMRQKGYQLFVITNQSGVGRGYFDLSTVHAIHRAIDEDLSQNGLPPFDGWSTCPHTPEDQCSCRKPKPQMILEQLKKHELNPQQCWMVGDKFIDAQCGKNAGINGAIVRDTSAQDPDFPFFKTLLAFAESLP